MLDTSNRKSLRGEWREYGRENKKTLIVYVQKEMYVRVKDLGVTQDVVLGDMSEHRTQRWV